MQNGLRQSLVEGRYIPKTGEYVNDLGWVQLTNNPRSGSVITSAHDYMVYQVTGKRTNDINGILHGGSKPFRYKNPNGTHVFYNKTSSVPYNVIRNLINAEHKLRLENRNRYVINHGEASVTEAHNRPIIAIQTYKSSPWYTNTSGRFPGTMTNTKIGNERERIRTTAGGLTGFKKGGKVPKSGLYKLHKGEVVVPAHRVKTVDKALKKDGKKPLKKVCKNCVMTKKQLKNRKVSKK
jgi:hypothetical protein